MAKTQPDTGVQFSDDVTLGEYVDIPHVNPDEDIYVSPSKGGGGREKFHIDDCQVFDANRMKEKHPATQFDDLVLCSYCRYRKEIRMDGLMSNIA